MYAAMGDQYTSLSLALWNTINSEIDVAESELYSFNIDPESLDEDASLWSFTFFFYNKKLKRIVFFFCQSTRSVNSWLECL